MVGPELDLVRSLDRWKLALSCVQVYRLLTVMSRHLAPVPGRLALYDIVERGDGRWEVQLLQNGDGTMAC